MVWHSTRRVALAALFAFSLLLVSSELMALACVSNGSGNWTTTSTWTSCGSSYPRAGDTASITAGHAVTLDRQNLEVDSLTWAGASSQLTCSSGATLSLMSWTTAATTDWFVSEYQGVDTNTGAEEAMGSTGPELTWAAGMAHAAAGEHVLFSKGGRWLLTGDQTFVGGGTIGSFGQGDDNRYGPRPLWNLGATNTLTQTGSAATTQYHTEISCGAVLTAKPIMDRTSCVAPCAIEFKVDVDHTQLPGTEPRLSVDTDGTEVGGGPDWILPVTVWDFGDPGAGDWTRGARATTGTPWPKNEEYPAPIAFHVYETAGTYAATSKTYYDGLTVDNSYSITIVAADTEWPPADTWCFANDNLDWAGCPSGATRVVTADFDVALNTDCNVDADTNRCLFRRGDTYTLSARVIHNHATPDDYMVGAFGTGAKPIVNDTYLSTTGAIQFNNTVRAHYSDIRFVGDGLTDSAKFFWHPSFTGLCAGVEHDDFLFSGIEVVDTDNGFNFTENTTAGAQETRPECANDNLVFYEVSVINAGIGANKGNDMFIQMSSGAVLGSDVGNRNIDEHGIRVKRGSDFVISHNNLGRVGDSTDNVGCGAVRHLITIRDSSAASWETDGDTEDAMAQIYTQRFSLDDNLFGVCGGNQQTIIVQPTDNGGDEEFWHTYSVSGNLINPSLRQVATTANAILTLGGSDILIENNALWLDTGITTGTTRGIYINNSKGKSSGQMPNTAGQRVHILNNSAFAKSGNLGNTLFIDIGSDQRDTFIDNNILVDLETVVRLTDAGTNTTECNGVGTACNPVYTTNTAPNDVFSASISGSGPPNLDWFKLSANYVAGASVGVVPDSKGAYMDAWGYCRQDASPWEGLDENGGAQCLLGSAAIVTLVPLWSGP